MKIRVYSYCSQMAGLSTEQSNIAGMVKH